MYFKQHWDARETSYMRQINWKFKVITIGIHFFSLLDICFITVNVIVQQICGISNKLQIFFNEYVYVSSFLHFVSYFLMFTQFSKKLIIILNGTQAEVSKMHKRCFNIFGVL